MSVKCSTVLLLLLAFAQCRRELAVTKSEICDDFAAGVCSVKAPPEGVYRFRIPRDKTNSWFDLGYFMYFHARQTPGMRVEFTRPVPASDTAHCAFTLSRGTESISGHLEGIRWDEDRRGFWCFDYLGSMLVNFHKKTGTVRARPEMSFFPVHLKIEWHGSSVQASVEEQIRLDWQEEGQ